MDRQAPRILTAQPTRRAQANAAARWAVVTLVLAALLLLVIWLVWHDAPLIHFLVRLYRDKNFLKEDRKSVV